VALIKITDSVHYIPGKTNIGVVKIGENCILIDSGLNEDEGKKILKELEHNNLTVKAIINTHSHADHCGGNKLIKQKTNCQIFAPQIETAFIEHPILEPISFFSGANPINELKNKFLFAEETKVDEEIGPSKKQICGKEFEFISLKGHSINQIGVAFDNVLFCGDSFFSKDILEKHKIPFFININETKKTLNNLANTKYSYYIPSHAIPINNISSIAQENLESIKNCEEKILELLFEPKETDNLIKNFCSKEQIIITSIQQYFLLKTTILAYLTYLQEINKIMVSIKDNVIVWVKKE